MSEEMFNKLLAKLETVGGRGWELLVEAEFVMGVSSLVMACVMTLISVTCGLICWRNVRLNAKESAISVGIVCGVICVFTGIIAIVHLDGLMSLFAPEAMALQRLLK